MNFQKSFYTLAFLTLSTYIVIQGKVILAPLIFSVILAVMVSPMVLLLSKKLKSKVVSYILVMAGLFGVVFTSFYFLSEKIIDLFSEVKNADGLLDQAQLSLQKNLADLPLIGNLNWEMRSQQLTKYTAEIWSGISSMLTFGGGFLISFILCVILTYFFLAYYHHFKREVFDYTSGQDRQTLRKVVQEVPDMLRSYFRGLIIVIGILAVANSLLFYIVGLSYPIVWGLAVASLAFIPYVGTLIGLLLPLSYSLITSGGITQPLMMILGYGIIQQAEGNILTPKIVGDHVNLNPLVALLVTVVGGLIWGVAGAIIAIPLSGFLRIYCLYEPGLEIVGKLMSAPQKNT